MNSIINFFVGLMYLVGILLGLVIVVYVIGSAMIWLTPSVAQFILPPAMQNNMEYYYLQRIGVGFVGLFLITVAGAVWFWLSHRYRISTIIN